MKNEPAGNKSSRNTDSHESVPIREILQTLKFQEVWGGVTEKDPSYLFNFGNLQLTAAQVTSLYLRPIFYFGGVGRGNNSLSDISFEIPLKVESFEQGVAWICYGIGKYFKPLNVPAWFTQGWEWQEHLPWVREQRNYEVRPQCAVEREWFKIAAKKLRSLSESANESDLAVFSFDGNVLQISACETILAMPAKGKLWEEKYSIQVNALSFLNKRFVGENIYISVWENKFSIGGRVWYLAQLPLLVGT